MGAGGIRGSRLCGKTPCWSTGGGLPAGNEWHVAGSCRPVAQLQVFRFVGSAFSKPKRKGALFKKRIL